MWRVKIVRMNKRIDFIAPSFSPNYVSTIESLGAVGKEFCDRCHRWDVTRITLRPLNMNGAENWDREHTAKFLR